MQGQQTESSVIAALERIFEVQDYFDVVVIIRGGGATVDLASFDSYQLAFNVANFPIPVITGIGHDRDETVLDHVAHTSVKTPTAAAALLIDKMAEQLQNVLDLQEEIKDHVEQRMNEERQRLQRFGNAIRNTHVTLTQQIGRLEMMGQKIQGSVHQRDEHRRVLPRHQRQGPDPDVRRYRQPGRGVHDGKARHEHRSGTFPFIPVYKPESPEKG